MKFILSILFLHLSLFLDAQIRIEVIKYPDFLFEPKRLFLATSFDNWNPSNPEFELKKDDKGIFFINLPDTVPYFEYKFTQGSWISAEGGPQGVARPNHIYEKNDLKTTSPKPQIIQISIENWETLPSYEFSLGVIPNNTPHDAQIYIAGNFNNWRADDPLYRLKKQLDGTYRVLVYSRLPSIEYKFSRGSWESVEGRMSGKPRPNRVFFKTDKMANKIENIEILSWEDLTGTFSFYSIYDILMLFSVLQGLLFIIAIPGIQDFNRNANWRLLLLMGFVSSMILIRVLWTYRDIAQQYPKFQLLPDFVMLIYAPLFYFYLQKLLFQTENLNSRRVVHFIPAIIMFLVYIPLFLMDSKVFRVNMISKDWGLQILFGTVGAVGLVFNAYYWWICRKALAVYKAQYQTRYSYEQNLHYLNTVLIIQAICLVLWLLTCILRLLGHYFFSENAQILESSNDMIWFAFSTITYFLGYYAIHQPEVFKIPQPMNLFENTTNGIIETISEAIPDKPMPLLQRRSNELKATVNPTEVKVHDEQFLLQKEKINNYLIESRAYTNPSLSLNELAVKLKIPPHTLSKVINDGFGKNFFDFINAYRIEEFKKLVRNPQYKNQTFLSLAFEVGFNSKTAFNRSFKKMTNQTPRDYFNLTNEEDA